MLETIYEYNCLYYIRLAEMFKAHDVLDKADEIVAHNFSTVIKIPEFLNLSKCAICRLLSIDELHKNSNELVVFQAVCAWLKNEPERITLAAELMKYINFTHLSPKEIREHILNCEVVMQDKACMDLVLRNMLSFIEGNEAPQTSLPDVPTQTAKKHNLFPGEQDTSSTKKRQVSTTQGSDHLFVLDTPNRILAGVLTEDSVAFHGIAGFQNISRYIGVPYMDVLFLVDIYNTSLRKYDIMSMQWRWMAEIRRRIILQWCFWMITSLLLVG